MRNAGIRTGAALVILAVGASYSDDDASDAAAKARTEPPTMSAADTSANDAGDDAATISQPRTAPSTLPAAAPVEFTACVNPGPEVQAGTEEFSQVSLPDGEMTITRSRGYTWQSTVRDVSDPRLDGTWYNSFDSDQYTIPGRGPGPELGTWTHRVENDDGAWQGSGVVIFYGDGESLGGPLVVIGEGAYEGLTAVFGIIGFGEAPCPNTRGYIIEGGVPAPPVPQTGQ
jgi:hypothetical protein